MCKAKDLSINRDNVECDCGNRNSIEFSPMIFDLPESDVKKTVAAFAQLLRTL